MVNLLRWLKGYNLNNPAWKAPDGKAGENPTP